MATKDNSVRRGTIADSEDIVRTRLAAGVVGVSRVGMLQDIFEFFCQFLWVLGARHSTSTWCTLGTSSQVLRMLTESGDVIRYVFLLSAGLRTFVLDVGGSSEPIFSLWEFVRLADQ